MDNNQAELDATLAGIKDMEAGIGKMLAEVKPFVEDAMRNVRELVPDEMKKVNGAVIERHGNKVIVRCENEENAREMFNDLTNVS